MFSVIISACAVLKEFKSVWKVGNQGDGLLDDFVARSKVAVESKDIQGLGLRV